MGQIQDINKFEIGYSGGSEYDPYKDLLIEFSGTAGEDIYPGDIVGLDHKSKVRKVKDSIYSNWVDNNTATNTGLLSFFRKSTISDYKTFFHMKCGGYNKFLMGVVNQCATGGNYYGVEMYLVEKEDVEWKVLDYYLQTFTLPFTTTSQHLGTVCSKYAEGLTEDIGIVSFNIQSASNNYYYNYMFGVDVSSDTISVTPHYQTQVANYQTTNTPNQQLYCYKDRWYLSAFMDGSNNLYAQTIKYDLAAKTLTFSSVASICPNGYIAAIGISSNGIDMVSYHRNGSSGYLRRFILGTSTPTIAANTGADVSVYGWSNDGVVIGVNLSENTYFSYMNNGSNSYPRYHSFTLNETGNKITINGGTPIDVVNASLTDSWIRYVFNSPSKGDGYNPIMYRLSGLASLGSYALLTTHNMPGYPYHYVYLTGSWAPISLKTGSNHASIYHSNTNGTGLTYAYSDFVKQNSTDTVYPITAVTMNFLSGSPSINNFGIGEYLYSGGGSYTTLSTPVNTTATPRIRIANVNRVIATEFVAAGQSFTFKNYKITKIPGLNLNRIGTIVFSGYDGRLTTSNMSNYENYKRIGMVVGTDEILIDKTNLSEVL